MRNLDRALGRLALVASLASLAFALAGAARHASPEVLIRALVWVGAATCLLLAFLLMCILNQSRN